MTAFARILHSDEIRRLAGTAVFAKGERYMLEGRVGVIRLREGELGADVRGTDLYRARIWARDSTLAYSCTCPFAREEAMFCKHLVALALTFLANREAPTARTLDSLAPPFSTPPTSAEVAAFRSALEALSKSELVELLSRAAIANPLVFAVLKRTHESMSK